MSPTTSDGQHSGNSSNDQSDLQTSQQSLRAMDFPPWTAAAVQEKRGPVATGAWAASRPILSPNLNGSPNTPQSARGEDTGNDHRNGCKPGDNHTPKLARRPVHSTGITNNHAPRLPQVGKETKTDSTALLAGQVALMTPSLGEEHVASGGGTLPSINTNPSSTTSSSSGAVST